MNQEEIQEKMDAELEKMERIIQKIRTHIKAMESSMRQGYMGQSPYWDRVIWSD